MSDKFKLLVLFVIGQVCFGHAHESIDDHQLMPECGGSYISRSSRSKRYSISPFKKDISWGLSTSDYPKYMTREETLEALREGIRVWQSILPFLNITEVDPTYTEPDIFIGFYGSDRYLHTHSYALTTNIYGRILIQFNLHYHWGKNADSWNITPIKDLTIHEFAHALGLDHSSDRRSIMYKNYIKGSQYLTPQDIQRMKTVFSYQIAKWEQNHPTSSPNNNPYYSPFTTEHPRHDLYNERSNGQYPNYNSQFTPTITRDNSFKDLPNNRGYSTTEPQVTTRQPTHEYTPKFNDRNQYYGDCPTDIAKCFDEGEVVVTLQRSNTRLRYKCYRVRDNGNSGGV